MIQAQPLLTREAPSEGTFPTVPSQAQLRLSEINTTTWSCLHPWAALHSPLPLLSQLVQPSTEPFSLTAAPYDFAPAVVHPERLFEGKSAKRSSENIHHGGPGLMGSRFKPVRMQLTKSHFPAAIPPWNMRE